MIDETKINAANIHEHQQHSRSHKQINEIVWPITLGSLFALGCATLASTFGAATAGCTCMFRAPHGWADATVEIDAKINELKIDYTQLNPVKIDSTKIYTMKINNMKFHESPINEAKSNELKTNP